MFRGATHFSLQAGCLTLGLGVGCFLGLWVLQSSGRGQDYSGGCVRVGVQADVLQSALLDACYAAAVPPGVLGALRLLLQQGLAAAFSLWCERWLRIARCAEFGMHGLYQGLLSAASCPFAVFLLLTGWVALA